MGIRPPAPPACPPALSSPPVVLSIAGSDCSAGAGIQADLKSFCAFGVYGLTAITCVVAEVPGNVVRIDPLPSAGVATQVRVLANAFPIAAAKTGMLHSRQQIESVVDSLPASIPLVVDPVMVATSGDALVLPDAVEACAAMLLPRARVMTPNLDEAAALLGGRRITAESSLEPAARALASRFGCAVLLKGGHLTNEAEAVDVLVDDGETHWFHAPRVTGVATHGTGCTLSAAIAANLALGKPLAEATEAAKQFVTQSIARSFHWDGLHALRHFD